jgi:hypothetical protein
MDEIRHASASRVDPLTRALKKKTTACLIPNHLRARTRHIVFKLVVLVV